MDNLGYHMVAGRAASFIEPDPLSSYLLNAGALKLALEGRITQFATGTGMTVM